MVPFRSWLQSKTYVEDGAVCSGAGVDTDLRKSVGRNDAFLEIRAKPSEFVS